MTNPAVERITINIPRRRTSERIVQTFLFKTGDYNPVHDIGLLPGMFYLQLAVEEMLKRKLMDARQLTKVKLEFKRMIRYPTRLEVEVQEGQDSEGRNFQTLDFREGLSLASVSFQYDGKNGYLDGNLDKIAAIERIPGDLQKFMGQSGVYIKQNVEFLEWFDKIEGNFSSKTMLGGKLIRIRTDYSESGDAKIKGDALVSPITPEILAEISRVTGVPVMDIDDMLQDYQGELKANPERFKPKEISSFEEFATHLLPWPLARRMIYKA